MNNIYIYIYIYPPDHRPSVEVPISFLACLLLCVVVWFISRVLCSLSETVFM